MKKILSLLLSAALLLCLAGCNASTNGPSATEQTPTSLISLENGQYTITLPQCGQTLTLSGTYEAFAPCITEELIRSADQALASIVAEDPEDRHVYLSTDLEGYLCLCIEVIVYLEPDDPEYPGCCIDHDHKFYRERISAQPVK